MPDAAWKATERAIAKRLGGTRVGPQGREGNDIAHPLFGCEVKERRKPLPKSLTDALAQAVNASLPGQLPIVVFHQLGQRHDHDVVLIRLSDFEQWTGTLEVEP